MKRKFFFRAAIFVIFTAVTIPEVFAQLTISGGFALSGFVMKLDDESSSAATGTGIGGNVYFDYLLPSDVPISLGFEIGVDTAPFTNLMPSLVLYTDTVIAIPLLFRIACHFNLMPKLDLYVVGKIGVALSFWYGELYDYAKQYGDAEPPFGVGLGFDLGTAFYFSSHFGFFVEGGYDRYNLSTKFTDETNRSWDLDIPISRGLTFGIIFRN
ncbi:MAG: hypothetical protein LBV52_02540 [Spirochaetaceae bacterium]|jgi:hypothetical protein|nr:hypothetical protein [Spirochaetaceae bacterium]